MLDLPPNPMPCVRQTADQQNRGLQQAGVRGITVQYTGMLHYYSVLALFRARISKELDATNVALLRRRITLKGVHARQHHERTFGHQKTTLFVSTSRALLDWPNNAWRKFPPGVCSFSVVKSKFTFELLQPSSCIIESSGRKSVALPVSSEKVLNVRPPQRNIFVVFLGASAPKSMALHRAYISLASGGWPQKSRLCRPCLPACWAWKMVEGLPANYFGSNPRAGSGE